MNSSQALLESTPWWHHRRWLAAVLAIVLVAACLQSGVSVTRLVETALADEVGLEPASDEIAAMVRPEGELRERAHVSPGSKPAEVPSAPSAVVVEAVIELAQFDAPAPRMAPDAGPWRPAILAAFARAPPSPIRQL